MNQLQERLQRIAEDGCSARRTRGDSLYPDDAHVMTFSAGISLLMPEDASRNQDHRPGRGQDLHADLAARIQRTRHIPRFDRKQEAPGMVVDLAGNSAGRDGKTHPSPGQQHMRTPSGLDHPGYQLTCLAHSGTPCPDLFFTAGQRSVDLLRQRIETFQGFLLIKCLEQHRAQLLAHATGRQIEMETAREQG